MPVSIITSGTQGDASADQRDADSTFESETAAWLGKLAEAIRGEAGLDDLAASLPRPPMMAEEESPRMFWCRIFEGELREVFGLLRRSKPHAVERRKVDL